MGAGVAGLAAAAALRRAGRRCAVVEAAGRIGGRAWTARPAALGGAVFDHGASWLHAAERNPLVAIARANGDTLRDADEIRCWRGFIGDRPATEAEREAYDRAEARFQEVMDARAAAGGPDVSLAEAAAGLPDDPWNATVLAWEALIAAADAEALSFLDWHANTLQGSNLLVTGGLGRFVARRLGTAAGPVALATPVRRIEWQPGGVRVGTDRGVIEAQACIVTVSTGVLASGAIDFAPALPPMTQAAIGRLPMGLLTKIALRATGEDRLGLPSRCTAHRQIGPGEALTVINCWPDGADHVVCFLGGSLAWELERAGPRAAEAHARAELARLFGGRAARAFAGGGCLVTRWGGDPWIRGAYCYPGPGHAGARLALARPLAGGALVFAGEACHPTLAGTVGGACLSGEQAARLARFRDGGS